MDAINRLKAVFHPARYHGWGRTRRYFEGWYFKVVDRSGSHAYAFIPGIAMNGHGDRHAFVQVLDGKRLTAGYHTFPVEAFQPASGKFDLTLGGNRFTEEFICLDLPGIRGNCASTALSRGRCGGIPPASWGPTPLYPVWSATMVF